MGILDMTPEQKTQVVEGLMNPNTQKRNANVLKGLRDYEDSDDAMWFFDQALDITEGQFFTPSSEEDSATAVAETLRVTDESLDALVRVYQEATGEEDLTVLATPWKIIQSFLLAVGPLFGLYLDRINTVTEEARKEA